MPVDNPAVLSRNRNVGEDAAHQPRAGGYAAHRADHRLVTVDDAVDHLTRLFPLPGTRVEILGGAPDHVEVAASGEHLPGASEYGDVDAVVAIDVVPDIGELGVHRVVSRVH